MEADVIEPSDAGPDEVAELARLLGPAAAGGRGRRSSLTRWMNANHDKFGIMLATKQPNWKDLAAALAAKGLRDGKGRPPTPVRACKTWSSVKKAYAAASTKRTIPATAPFLAQGEIAPAVRATPAFTTANAPVNTPTRDSMTHASLTQPLKASEDVMRRLRNQMQADKEPMPKVVADSRN